MNRDILPRWRGSMTRAKRDAKTEKKENNFRNMKLPLVYKMSHT